MEEQVRHQRLPDDFSGDIYRRAVARERDLEQRITTLQAENETLRRRQSLLKKSRKSLTSQLLWQQQTASVLVASSSGASAPPNANAQRLKPQSLPIGSSPPFGGVSSSPASTANEQLLSPSSLPPPPPPSPAFDSDQESEDGYAHAAASRAATETNQDEGEEEEEGETAMYLDQSILSLIEEVGPYDPNDPTFHPDSDNDHDDDAHPHGDDDRLSIASDVSERALKLQFLRQAFVGFFAAKDVVQMQHLGRVICSMLALRWEEEAEVMATIEKVSPAVVATFAIETLTQHIVQFFN